MVRVAAILALLLEAKVSPILPPISDVINRLSLDDKAAMMMLIGIPGRSVTPATEHWFSQRHASGVILFPTNIGTPHALRDFVRSLQNLPPAEHGNLLISVDQEGGRVRRLRNNVTFLPSPMTVGMTESPGMGYMAGMVAGKELFALGINTNLAPVLDLYNSRQDRLIGTRSFGRNPRQVGAIGSAYIKALQLQGVSATAKHFPGHGEAQGDSHYTLPISNITLERWKRTHRVPFDQAIAQGADLMMTAHVRFPQLLKELQAPETERDLPASFSPTLLTQLLRNEMGFRGVVVTDDLEMHAIRKKWRLGDAAVKSLEAGSDMVMVAWTESTKEEVFSAIRDAIQSGRLSERKVTETLTRILTLRRQKANSEHEVGQAPLEAVLRNPSHQRTAVMMRQQGLALVQATDKKVSLPALSSFASVILHASNHQLLESMELSVRRNFAGSVARDALVPQKTEDTQALHLFILRNAADQRQLKAWWTGNSEKVTHSGLISMDTPHLLSGFSNATFLLCTFNNDGMSLNSVAALLAHHTRTPFSQIPLRMFD
jgi:beta-N-acetylhexosaminidase